MKKVEVKKQPKSKTYGVYVDGKLFEGGFFEKAAAERAAKDTEVWYYDLCEEK